MTLTKKDYKKMYLSKIFFYYYMSVSPKLNKIKISIKPVSAKLLLRTISSDRRKNPQIKDSTVNRRMWDGPNDAYGWPK